MALSSQTKKTIIFVFLVFLIVIGVIYRKQIHGVIPAIAPSDKNISDLIANNESPLKVRNGFALTIFADGVKDARVIAFDDEGNLWVSQTSQGKITKLTVQNGNVVDKNVILENLKNPHGIAFDPNQKDWLYFAEETKISKININKMTPPEKIVDLPNGGRHFTRTLGFGPDKKLYVSIGSTCDVCDETDQQVAKIFQMNADGSELKEYASGLRNSVFFTWNPTTQQMWATEMGRDNLGDNLPPDEINIVEEGENYGWPICYGKNIHDSDFDKNMYIQNPCLEPTQTPSFIDISAHSAPLGLAFAPQTWPSEYHGNLFVAYHGSWNKTRATGYKIVRYIFDQDGREINEEDFITGWLSEENSAIGRPVDIVAKGDALYLSDDKAGVIYKVSYEKNLNDETKRECKRTGCSGQICSDKDAVTTCEWQPSYACYNNAVCERQADGNCAWKQTDELKSCLEKTK